MPKPSLHVLAWSQERQRHELSTHGHLRQSFHPDDRQHWQGWLSEQTSFAFQGRHGQMSVIQEARPRGAGYWYAYSTHHRHTRKRYLGPTPRVTLERLEQEAEMLAAASVVPPQKARQAPREVPGSSPRRGNVMLLETRYTLPRLPSTLIKRERLLTALDAVLEHRLLVCSASAGAGKTTLLSAWAAQSPHQVAWLSLDESENEPARFWSAIIVALRHSSPGLSQVGDLALDMVHAAQPPPLSTVLTNLISDIQNCSGEIILILDDYHVIEDRVIQDAMLFLLDHLPANLHLVLSCRVDPALPLSRWRVRGQMIEIREAELRFTSEEADSFLREGMRLSLARRGMAVSCSHRGLDRGTPTGSALPSHTDQSCGFCPELYRWSAFYSRLCAGRGLEGPASCCAGLSAAHRYPGAHERGPLPGCNGRTCRPGDAGASPARPSLYDPPG